jgi:hypothetical protein
MAEDEAPTINPKAEPRRSTQATKPSAAGATSKGIPHASKMHCIQMEIWASEERLKCQCNDKDISSPLQDGLDLLMLSSNDDPQDYKDAMSRPDAADWTKSIAEELASFKAHNMWTLIPRSEILIGHKVIPSKAVFHYKLDESGNVARHKTRIVAKGFAQKPGIDFNDTFTPVACMESMRTILHIGMALNWDIHQMDVKTTFLHGNLEEEIYMEQREGGKEKGREKFFVRLNKTLYGLMQAV